jgi:circadian clock protein KaiC
MAATAQPPLELLPTGVPGFDAILEGGLPARRMYLLQGDPGAGKTTLALQFLLAGVRAGIPEWTGRDLGAGHPAERD